MTNRPSPLVEISRLAQLVPSNRNKQTEDGETHDGALHGAIDAASKASSDQEDGKEAGHGLGLGRCVHARHELGKMLLGESCKNTIGNAVGQSFGPLGHSRGGNADCLGCGCDRASEKFNGF